MQRVGMCIASQVSASVSSVFLLLSLLLLFACLSTVDRKRCNHGDGNVTRKVDLRCFKLRRAYSISFDSSNVGKFYRS